jgi:uncharacterized membrane protein YfcA
MMDTLSAAIIVACAGFLQGVTGFGAGLVSMGLLSLMWPISHATAVMSPVGLALTLSLLARQRRAVNRAEVSRLLLGLPIGIIVGVLSLEHLSDPPLKLALGLALLFAVLNAVWGREARLPSWIAPIAGALAGFTGASLSSPGPPVLIYATLSGWSKDSFRANLAALFFTSNLLAFTGLSLRGMINTETLKVSVFLIPCVALASLLGASLGDKLPQALFKRMVLVLLGSLSARFLWGVFGA